MPIIDPGAYDAGNVVSYRPPVAAPSAPAAPAAPTAPGLGGALGSTAYLDTFPGVLAAKNAESSGIADLDAMLKKLREQAIIQFGDASLAGQAGFGVDPSVAQAANANVASTMSQLSKQHDYNRQAIINQLIGRGLIHSGDLGFQEGRENERYGVDQYNARNQFLEQLGQAQQQYLDRKNALRSAVLDSYQNAFGQFLQNPELFQGLFGPTPTTTPTPANPRRVAPTATEPAWMRALRLRSEALNRGARVGAAY